jgi:hypothetical protein
MSVSSLSSAQAHNVLQTKYAILGTDLGSRHAVPRSETALQLAVSNKHNERHCKQFNTPPRALPQTYAFQT